MVSLVFQNIPPIIAASSKSPPLNTIEKIHMYFPESYWSGLDTLKLAHPKWKFVAFNTGLNWEDCFSENAECYPSRNLAHGYINGKLFFPTSWYSTEIEGAYNWSANEWTKYDNGNWLQASKEAIAYCMDPRNFLTETQVFQFLDMASALNPEDSYIACKTILKGNYWNRSGEESDLYCTVKEDGSKVYIDFAHALTQIGIKLNINQVTLSSRLYQENGSGTSPLITGTQIFTLPNNTVINGGYYNYFNVNASGNSNSAIIQNGLRTAYENGWDTKYKSLEGGANEIMKSFIKRGQTTIYLQKFSVDSSSPRLFWGQYMQNITAPQSESQTTYNAMAAANALNADLTFIIPIFNNMPDSNPCPSGDGNPNYKLGSVYINGQPMTNFNADRFEYNGTIDGNELKVNMLTYAPTTRINFNGQSYYGKISTIIPLNYGSNILKFECVAENGTTRTYTFNINRIGQLPIETTPPPVVTQPTETITPPIVTQPIETTPPPAIETTVPPDSEIVETDEPDNNGNTSDDNGDIIDNSNNEELSGENNENNQPSEDVTSNDNVEMIEPTENVPIETQPISPPIPTYGDLTQDGEWDIFDAAVIYSHILGTQQLSDNQRLAADINKDGEVDIFDAAIIYQFILGFITTIG